MPGGGGQCHFRLPTFIYGFCRLGRTINGFKAAAIWSSVQTSCHIKYKWTHFNMSPFQVREGVVSPDAEEVSVILDTEQAARERRISLRLQNLYEQLKIYVTSPLEVPEVKQDQLKTPVKLDLLTKLSERLQELYSEVQAMVTETCKCSEDLKKEFYDFAYHGLRAVHNDLVPRVTDLESVLGEMSEEEKKDFERLAGHQVNRQRQVKRMDNLWKGLFSPVCSTVFCLWTFSIPHYRGQSCQLGALVKRTLRKTAHHSKREGNKSESCFIGVALSYI